MDHSLSPQESAHLWVLRSLVHHLQLAFALDSDSGQDPHHNTTTAAAADPQALHILARLFARYLSDLACFASSYAQASGRSRAQFSDLTPTLDRVGFSLAELHAQLLSSAPAARASHADYASSSSPSNSDSGIAGIAPFTPISATSTNILPLLPILAPTYGHDTKLVPVSALDQVTATQSIHPSYPIIVDPEKHPLVVKKLQSLPLRPPPPPPLPDSSESATPPASSSSSSTQAPLATVIVPRTKFPPHVPNACPKFPPPHTYMRTPVMPLHATHTSRAPLLADQRKLMEANLRRLMSWHPKLFSAGPTSSSATLPPPPSDGEPMADQTPAAVAQVPHYKPRLAVIMALTLSQPAAKWWKHPPAELPKQVLDALALAPAPEEEEHTAHNRMDVDPVSQSPARSKSPAKSPPAPRAAATTASPSPRKSPEHRPATLALAADPSPAPASSAPEAPVHAPSSSPPPPARPTLTTSTSPNIKLTLRSPTPARAQSPPPPAVPLPSMPSYPRAQSPLATSPPSMQPAAAAEIDSVPVLPSALVAAQSSAGGSGNKNGHALPLPTTAGHEEGRQVTTLLPATSVVAVGLGQGATGVVDDSASLASSNSSMGTGTGTDQAGNRPRVTSGGILRLKIKPLGGVAPPPPPPAGPANGGGA